MSQFKSWFLNVGQGDATYWEFTDSTGKVWRGLIDCNLDRKRKGIDVHRFVEDKMPTVNGKRQLRLDFLIVTHPHSDHIQGLKKFGDDYEIGELWDSGHIPEEGNDNCLLFEDYEKVKEKHKAVLKLHKMSRDTFSICNDELTVHVFSPSNWVAEADERTGEDRREAIHSECLCFKFVFAEIAVLFAGDSNWLAWERITDYDEYDEATLEAKILHVSHHGSRTFFHRKKEDEPLRAGIERISPEVLIISVPEDSPHEHPHEDAMDIYREYVTDEENIHLTHKNSLVLSIEDDGSWDVQTDESIQAEYEFSEEEETSESRNSSTGSAAKSIPAVFGRSRSQLDHRPAASAE